MKHLLALLILLISSNCYADEYGSDWDWDPYAPAMVEMTVAHVVDLISTGVALTVVEGATEANPLGWYIIPAKVALTYGVIPMFPQEQQAQLGSYISDITWGGVVNNSLIIAGASGPVAIAGGAVVGLYLLGCDLEVLPESICIMGYDYE